MIESLATLGAATIRQTNTEADDVLATLARSVLGFSEASKVTIVSPDKDFFQLLSPRVTLARRWGWTPDTDEVWFAAKFGFAPALHADMLALCGDAVDDV